MSSDLGQFLEACGANGPLRLEWDDWETGRINLEMKATGAGLARPDPGTSTKAATVGDAAANGDPEPGPGAPQPRLVDPEAVHSLVGDARRLGAGEVEPPAEGDRAPGQTLRYRNRTGGASAGRPPGLSTVNRLPSALQTRTRFLSCISFTKDLFQPFALLFLVTGSSSRACGRTAGVPRAIVPPDYHLGRSHADQHTSGDLPGPRVAGVAIPSSLAKARLHGSLEMSGCPSEPRP